MTAKNLFTIILKILGLYFIKDIVALVPQLLSVILYLTKGETISEAIWILLTTALTLAAYVLVAYVLIFKSDVVINKLKLDQGFDQDPIPLNIHRSTILSISVIVIGGLILIEEIPDFCRYVAAYFQEKRMTNGLTKPSAIPSVLAAAKAVIGLLLINYQRPIVNFIEHRRKGR